jgi:thiol-disulfide isomerase/thioredoxin
MKKLILAALVAVAGWFTSQAQSMPAPERYNQLLEQMVLLEQPKAEFLMQATMETLSKDPKGYRQMLDLAEKRFSDAADPLHNEGLYMVVLKHAIDNYILSNNEKERQRLLLEGAKKNMIGTVAADFDYITPDSKDVKHLKDLKADYILVYFNNPDCESCETVKQRLAENQFINKMVGDKKLIVLAIYPYDDQKLWKKAKYPKMMVNGWNQSHQIEYAELYDLPTLPCFYLLNKDYKVLVKNEGSLNKVEAKLKQLTADQVSGPSPMP